MNRAAIIRDRVQNRHPGAIVSRRGRRFLEHKAGETTILDVSLGKLHTASGNEIDTTWIDADPPDAPWLIKQTLNDFAAYAGPGTDRFSAGQIIRYVHHDTGKDITFQPQQLQWRNDLNQIAAIGNPAPVSWVRNDGDLIWAAAFGPGFDFRWRCVPGTLKADLSVAALDPPPQYILDGGNPVLRLGYIFSVPNDVDVWVDGSIWDRQSTRTTASAIEFRLGSNPLWSFRTPIATDADAGAQAGTMRLRKTGNSLIVDILVSWQWLETAAYPVVIDPTIEVSVTSQTDDGYYTAYLYYPSLSQVRFGDSNNAVLRFASVTIPQNATIDDAYFYELTAYASESVSANNLIKGIDEANPLRPETLEDIKARDRTTESVNWLTEAWTVALEYTSASFASVVQEMVDSYDYSSGAAMMFVIEDNGGGRRTFNSADNGFYVGLHIEYNQALHVNVSESVQVVEAKSLLIRGASVLSVSTTYPQYTYCRVMVGGSDYTAHLADTEQTANVAIGSDVGRATLVFVDEGSLPSINEWDEITISAGPNNLAAFQLWGGFATRIIYDALDMSGGSKRKVTVECQSYTLLLHTTEPVTRSFRDKYDHAIVESLVKTYLGEAYTSTTISASSPVFIEYISFEDQSLLSCLQQVSKRTGAIWGIDAEKRFYYHQPGTSLPYDKALSDNPDNISTFPMHAKPIYDRDGVGLRNRIRVIGGWTESAVRQELFSGDGNTHIFTVVYRPEVVEGVWVNGVSQRVGVDFVTDPADVDVLVNYDTKQFKFNTPPPSGTKNIDIRYRYSYRVEADCTDSASLARLGRSLWAPVLHDESLTTTEEAVSAGLAWLSHNAAAEVRGQVTTNYSGNRWGIGGRCYITAASIGWSSQLVSISNIVIRLVSYAQGAGRCVVYFDLSCGTSGLSFTEVMHSFSRDTKRSPGVVVPSGIAEDDTGKLGDPPVFGWIGGLSLRYNSSASIIIGPGSCADSDNQVLIEVMQPISVSLASSGAGGLDTGAENSNTIYYVYVIATDSGSVSGLFSTVQNTPTMPSGYVYYRLVGAVRNNGSSNIAEFDQSGTGVVRRFLYRTGQVAYSGTPAASESQVSFSGYVPAAAPEASIEWRHPNGTSGTQYTYHLGWASGHESSLIELNGKGSGLTIGRGATGYLHYTNNTDLLHLRVLSFDIDTLPTIFDIDSETYLGVGGITYTTEEIY